MPELMRCPACGVGVRISDAYLGKSLVCSACGHSFVAGVEQSPSPLPFPPPRLPRSASPGSSALLSCPQCGRCVSWDVQRCPYCGEEFEPVSAPPQGADSSQRRDWEPHRGKLLCTLGIISLALNFFSFCTGGIAALLSVATGLTTWILAQQDLRAMQTGLMDPAGESSTEMGRGLAIFGAFLGVMQCIAHGASLLRVWF